MQKYNFHQATNCNNGVVMIASLILKVSESSTNQSLNGGEALRLQTKTQALFNNQ